MQVSDLQSMLVALRESMTRPTKREAGMVLAEGGWAVFPLPNNQKFDQGLSYLNATTDPARWWDMCESVMERNECVDVNIALCPGKCAVPLIVVDLDGAEAIQRFFDDAMNHGHIDIGMWLRVNTTRPDHGRHLYFAAPDGKQWSNSTHIWGGDVRSGRGHVVMPPSTTETGMYTWVGDKLYGAPDWVIEGLRGGRVKDGSRDSEKSDEEIAELLEELSQWSATSYGHTALNNMLADMREARPGDQRGGRNPHLSKTINRVMDLAVERHLNALEAINLVAEQYVALFSVDELAGRNPLQEVVRCVNSWFRNHDTVALDAQDANVIMEWANQRGGGQTQTVPDVIDTVMTAEDTSPSVRTRAPRRRSGRDWKAQANK